MFCVGVQAGTLVTGTVTSIKPFGAVVKIDGTGGTVGLLHISEISNARVTDTAAIFKQGDKVGARLLLMCVDAPMFGAHGRMGGVRRGVVNTRLGPGVASSAHMHVQAG